MKDKALVARTVLSLSAFLCVALLTGPPALAFIDPGLTLSRLNEEAEYAVIGEVERVWVEVGSWPNVAHDVPITHAEIRVEETLKGNLEGGLITVSVPGGESPDGTRVRVSDTPELIAGERELLFLARPAYLGRTVVYGWSHGLFPITRDDRGVERVLSPFNPNVYDGAPLDRIRAITRGEADDDLAIPVVEKFSDLGADRAAAACGWCGSHTDGVADLYVNPNFADSCAGSTSAQTAALQGAADEWTDRGGACFAFNNRGTTSVDYVSLSDGKNVIFSTNVYGYGALAATWCVMSVNRGTDTEFYDAGISLCTDPGWGQVDIQGVATHELGHQIGMDHLYSGSATMYPSMTGTGTSARSIESADMDCLQSIYGSCGSTGSFFIDAEGYYQSGVMHLDFVIGTPQEAVWANYLMVTVPSTQVYELWTVPLPVLDPPTAFPVEFPLDVSGLIYIYSGLHTAQGEQDSILLYGEF